MIKRSERFSPLVFILCTLTIGLGITHIGLREYYPPGHTVRLVVTSLMMLALASFIFVYSRLIASLDEYQRQIQLFALAIGFPLSLVLVWAIGYFRAEGLLQGSDPRDLPMVMLIAYAIGYALAWMKYR
ncbi:MAG: hypothetical protein AABN95_13175 [Acidobacteriota bacterium]